MNHSKHILIATGGTGGHLFPAQAIYKILTKKGWKVSFMLDKRALNFSHFLPKAKIIKISARGIAGHNFLYKMLSIILLSIGFIKAFIKLIFKRPHVAIGFGSYAQVPALFAAYILRIPIVVHEANAVIGKANKFFYNRNVLVASAFSLINSDLKNIYHVGMPVRAPINNLYGKPYFPPNKNEKIYILITAGSLGSRTISQLVPAAFSKLDITIRKRLHITQQSRKEDIDSVKLIYNEAGINAELRVFIRDIEKHLSKAHLVICRAGAATIAENTLASRPAIYIPLPSSIDKHQDENAYAVEKKGAGWVILENKTSSKKLAKKIKTIISDNKLLRNTSMAAYKFSFPNSAQILSTMLEKVANEKI